MGADGNVTNEAIAAAFTASGLPASTVSPAGLLVEATASDVVLNRVDVSPLLDGPAEGLWDCSEAEARGALLLNRPTSLYLAHDKLATATVLAQAEVAHPRTRLLQQAVFPPARAFPCVVKPRFGSWGQDVVLCEDELALRRATHELAARPWFLRDGALVQELIGSDREDLRVLVAGGGVVGAVRRVAAAGEWRTNVAAGARRVPVAPSRAARELALRAVRALRLDLAGVDLMRNDQGELMVLEVNGAVDFTADYSLGGTDVFEAVARRLAARAERIGACRRPQAVGLRR